MPLHNSYIIYTFTGNREGCVNHAHPVGGRLKTPVSPCKTQKELSVSSVLGNKSSCEVSFCFCCCASLLAKPAQTLTDGLIGRRRPVGSFLGFGGKLRWDGGGSSSTQEWRFCLETEPFSRPSEKLDPFLAKSGRKCFNEASSFCLVVSEGAEARSRGEQWGSCCVRLCAVLEK